MRPREPGGCKLTGREQRLAGMPGQPAIAAVAGASGFLGQLVVADLTRQGYRVRTVGRGPGSDVRWDDPNGIRAVVDGATLLINLAGKNVNCRYTERNRSALVASRLETTRALREAVCSAGTPPELWLNASTATVYRFATDRPQTETTGEIGSGFSIDIARAWEHELFREPTPTTRRVALRLAVVLGDGPATRQLFRLAKLGVGGPQYDGPWFPHRRYRGLSQAEGGAPEDGTERPREPLWAATRGRQQFSWIHARDALRAMWHIRDTPTLSGAINLAAPEPQTNRELMAALRRVVGVPLGIPSHRWMLEPVLWAMRSEPELLFKSRWVLPERLLESGFTFHWPSLEPALADVFAAQRQPQTSP